LSKPTQYQSAYMGFPYPCIYAHDSQNTHMRSHVEEKIEKSHPLSLVGLLEDECKSLPITQSRDGTDQPHTRASLYTAIDSTWALFVGDFAAYLRADDRT